VTPALDNPARMASRAAPGDGKCGVGNGIGSGSSFSRFASWRCNEAISLTDGHSLALKSLGCHSSFPLSESDRLDPLVLGGAMRVRFLGLAVIVAMWTLGCSSSTNGSECIAAGGRCFVGGDLCMGTGGPDDCGPDDQNPGGSSCCVPCPAGQTPNDGGFYPTGCH
jgi:hypothetical protein